MRLAGKRALVTGGASGIGAATAERFAAEGATVAIADLNGAGADKRAAAIRAQGGSAVGLAADVGDDESVAAMIDHAVAWANPPKSRPRSYISPPTRPAGSPARRS